MNNLLLLTIFLDTPHQDPALWPANLNGNKVKREKCLKKDQNIFQIKTQISKFQRGYQEGSKIKIGSFL